MLTARAEAADRVRGLEIGADDYLAKPFEPRELLLRIATSCGAPRASAPPAPSEPSVRFGPFMFQLERGELRRGDEVDPPDRARARHPAPARPATPASTLPREALAGDGGGANERTVDVQINRLRRKIEPDPANPLLSPDGARHRLPPAASTMSASSAHRACAALPTLAAAVARFAPLARRPAAEGPLRPLAAHHHRADGAAAIGDRLCLHGAPLAARDPPPVGRGDAPTSRR